MSQQPTLATIWSTIESTIATAAGVTVEWKFQNYNQPALDYIALSLGAMGTAGIDFIDERDVPAWLPLTAYAIGDRVVNDSNKSYRCTVAGTSAAMTGPTGTGAVIVDGSVMWAYVSTSAGIALTVGGVREVPLQIEAFSASTVEQVAQATALSLLDAIVTKLRLPLARGALAAVGVTPFDPGPVNWIPSIVSTTFRGRATCDIRCRMPARALAEYADFIASVTGTATITGAPGGTLSPTFTAP